MRLKVIDIAETSRRIRDRVAAKNLKASDIQKRLHLQSIQGIYAWYSTKSKSLPSLEHLLQLADILNCTMEDLLVTREVEIPEE